jgi:serine/threonine protein kinase
MAVTIGSQLGSYEITALLGKGGFGEVYRAKDKKLKRDVAIKILPDEFSSDHDRLTRFQREAEVLASLNNPNIAAIYDLASQDQSQWLVLELVDGETLAERITRGPIPVEETLNIAKQIAEALEAAHEKRFRFCSRQVSRQQGVGATNFSFEFGVSVGRTPLTVQCRHDVRSRPNHLSRQIGFFRHLHDMCKVFYVCGM